MILRKLKFREGENKGERLCKKLLELTRGEL